MAQIVIQVGGSAVWMGQVVYDVSDADFQLILDWAKDAYKVEINVKYNPDNNPDFAPTDDQIVMAWTASWMQGTADASAKFHTPPQPPPPDIIITTPGGEQI